MKSGFSLDKWYLDVISPSGDCCIGYHADLHIRKRTFSYSALLSSVGQQSAYSVSYRQSRPPLLVNPAQIEWEFSPVNLCGTWKSLQPSFSKTLYRHESGEVRWECYFPLAASRIESPAMIVEGFGYAERLSLDLPPWKLPIRELRWGRFTSEEISVVWIEWRGEFPLSVLLLNGVDAGEGRISDDAVETDGFSLALQKFQTLREGFVVHTALRNFPGIHTVLPKQARTLHETKWLSRGVLRLGNTVCHGWAIHEVVRW